MVFDAILINVKLEVDEAGQTRISGNCYADRKKRFVNGEIIHTSRVIGNEGQVFITKNSRYLVVMGG